MRMREPDFFNLRSVLAQNHVWQFKGEPKFEFAAIWSWGALRPRQNMAQPQLYNECRLATNETSFQ